MKLPIQTRHIRNPIEMVISPFRNKNRIILRNKHENKKGKGIFCSLSSYIFDKKNKFFSVVKSKCDVYKVVVDVDESKGGFNAGFLNINRSLTFLFDKKCFCFLEKFSQQRELAVFFVIIPHFNL